eukprot:TRINITY_DN3026_c0_g1_i1.p1 TRINITY_DN3026_c0_g1~~TRINITY_DN3026_c0_g1_i1.p1  ORF type:complete len:717 (-),score=129.43 TRINITY_DN3026_c0_g1_i1:118-2268(-)
MNSISSLINILERNPKKSLLGFVLFYYVQSKLSRKSKKSNENINETGNNKRIQINKDFYKEIRKLINILIPSFKSKEFLILSLHTAFLVSRTFISIQVANLDGSLVKSIVEKDLSSFLWNLSKWLGLAIPATYVNSMIRYLEKQLAVAFRTKLVGHMYELYMKNETYYRVENMDSRIKNADQSLTQDAASFCDHLAHIHSQISKPILDIILMSLQLIMLNRKGNEKVGGSNGGPVVGTILGLSTVWITGKLLKALSPPFGKLTALEAQYEGELRASHSRLITHSEEIAFYHGHETEKHYLFKAYTTLSNHLNEMFRVRIWYNMLEGFLMKYLWSATGLFMVAIPVFTRKDNSADGKSSETISDRTEGFITARNLLLNLADACERIMSSYKEITSLAGYTHRVSQLLEVFEDVGKGNYSKKLTTTANQELMSSRGTVTEGEYIEFDGVPIVSPNGDVLIESLSFRLDPGMHTLISGPNGCGKSSLFRILAGLWPVYRGKLTKLSKNNLFYIPQRPYLSQGNLRDQIIYPDTFDDMKKRGYDDKSLDVIMSWVDLSSIVSRDPKGWDAVHVWADVLSGGEKQRVAMARLFYHKPKYAILDECTSQVSEDIEGAMYMKAKELGITLLTVTHRHTLWKYHEYLLQMNGYGGWKFSLLDASTRMSLKDEKAKIEYQLRGIQQQKERLRELCSVLGETSRVLHELDGTPQDDETTDDASINE